MVLTIHCCIWTWSSSSKKRCSYVASSSWTLANFSAVSNGLQLAKNLKIEEDENPVWHMAAVSSFTGQLKDRTDSPVQGKPIKWTW